MAKVNSKQELTDYCLRNLGGGVVNIEVSEEQLSDRIDETIEFFVERHYLGAEETILRKTISHTDMLNGYTDIPDEFRSITEVYSPGADSNTLNDSGVTAWDSLEYQMEDMYNRTGLGAGNSMEMSTYYISMEHFSTMRYLMDTRKRFTHNPISGRFTPIGWSFSDLTIYERVKDRGDLTSDEWTKGVDTEIVPYTIAIPNGDLRATKIKTSVGATILSVSQEIDLKQYYDKKEFSGVINLKALEYDGDVNVIIKDEYDVEVMNSSIPLTDQFNSTYFKFKLYKTNGSKLTLYIESADPVEADQGFSYATMSIWQNPNIIITGWKAMGEDAVNIFNDRWIKSFATALIGMQWGANVGKFAGVQLPGGIEIDGDKIYDRYTSERDILIEKFSEENELPIDAYVA